MSLEAIEKININIPEQSKGSNTNNYQELILDENFDSKEKYEVIKKRLLDINNWGSICGNLSGEFILLDSQGNEKSSKPNKGDLIKINIPLTTSIEGQGFEWVKIQEIKEINKEEKNINAVYFTLSPTGNPNTDSDTIAHFYTDDATNTFIILRENNKIYVGIHGRNEVANIEQTDSLIDKILNRTIALGAIIGVSSIQWANLIKALLKD
ncbi:MAG: hypothetical protein U0354_13175 [Candidatus Sericytochromatia bacterium]